MKQSANNHVQTVGGALPFSSDILSKKIIGKIKPSKASSFPFKLKSGNATPFKLMGSSPAKIMGLTQGGLKGIFSRGGVNPHRRRPTVPPHGPEAHTGGGSVGGSPQEAPAGGGGEGGGDMPVWNVGTAIGEMEGMDKMGQHQYMQGLDPSQRDRVRSQQRKTRLEEIRGRHKNLLGGFSGMFSDIRLKEKIQRTGNSPSGIPIYEFNYIGDSNRYSGAMAQDLLEINPDAVSMDVSGYYKVNYDNIDVDMHLI